MAQTGINIKMYINIVRRVLPHGEMFKDRGVKIWKTRLFGLGKYKILNKVSVLNSVSSILVS